jgi:transcriptional regulator with XRE-family HTH domain
MPSYYNHSNKPARKTKPDNFDPKTFFSEEEFEDQSRDVKKIKVKWLKTTTDMTRLEIAEEIGVSVSTVDDYWKEVREEDAYKLEELADKQIRKQLREYEYMKMQLFEAWEKSKEVLLKKKSEAGYRGETDIAIQIEEEIERMPKIDYFSEIRQINSEISKLLGIVKMTEINFNQQNNNVNVIGGGPSLTPDSQDEFTKKPPQLTDGYTSIDDEIDDADFEEL